MSIMIKGVVSAAALLIAVSAAHAQTDERPKGEGRQQGGAQQQQQQERGGQQRPDARGGDKQPDAKPAQAGEKRDEKSAQPAAQEKREDNRPQQGQAGDKRDDNRNAQDKPDRDNRQGGASDRKDGPNQASRPEGKSERRKISVSAEQRPRYRDTIKRHSNIKRYNRSEVNFTINLGTRIPDTYVFYDAPSEFYDDFHHDP
jgi:hypothetical protein